MDGLFFDQALKWIVCELIRLFSPMPVHESAALVAKIAVRWTPAIWEQGDRKRVLLEEASPTDEVLALLHFSDGTASLAELRQWTGAKNITHFRDRQILKLHYGKMVDFNPSTKIVHLLPKGIKRVEEDLLPADLQGS